MLPINYIKNSRIKPASNNLHNKDMIISCRFHKANILDKIKSYENYNNSMK